MSVATALRWTQILAAIAALVGTLELIVTRRSWGDRGTWQWRSLRDELPWAGAVLAARPFLFLLILRAVAALFLGWDPSLVATGTLWATSLLVHLRFRGPYNGGSDHMLMLVLSALFLASLGSGHPVMQRAAVVWIGVQATLSYFVAGVAKLRSAGWRRGTVLPALLAIPAYGAPRLARQLVGNRTIATTAAWGVLAFECGFPLALLTPAATTAAIALAVAFHTANAWVFGLNRFLLVWAATWPAIAAVGAMIQGARSAGG